MYSIQGLDASSRIGPREAEGRAARPLAAQVDSSERRVFQVLIALATSGHPSTLYELHGDFAYLYR